MANVANLLILRSFTAASPTTGLLNGQLAYSFVSNNLFIGANSGPIIIGGQAVVRHGQAAFLQANSAQNLASYAAYTANNAYANGVFLQGINDQQNTNIYAANTYANSAYRQANTGTVLAQAAYDQANSISAYANASIVYIIGVDNGQNTYAQAAYAQANAISSYANTTLAYGTGVDLGQNAYAQAAYAQANSGSSYANTTLTYLAGVNLGQNVYAQNAYAKANATNTYAFSAYAQANATNTYAFSAYSQANAISSYANTLLAYITGVDTGQNAYAQAAYASANANAAYANATLSYITGVNAGQNSYMQAAYAAVNANALYANTTLTYYAGIQTGQNAYAQAAYGQANAISSYANTTLTYYAGIQTGQNAYAQAAYAAANANALFANTTLTYLAGVDLGQNAYAQAGFTTANNAVANLGPIVTVNSAAVVYVANTTISTSKSTGALQVAGGVGIQGNTYVGQNLTVANSVSISGTSGTYTGSNSLVSYASTDNNVTTWDLATRYAFTNDTVPTGLTFKADGTVMYVTGTTIARVYQLPLSTAWNPTTAVNTAAFAVGTQDTSPQDISFKPDGTQMYILGNTNKAVYQYYLSTPWDVNTASFITGSNTPSLQVQDATLGGLAFRPDGTQMFVLGSANDAVYLYTLSTPWSVNTATYTSSSPSVATYEGTGNGLAFNSDGTKFWVTGGGLRNINEYTLSTAWNPTTAVFKTRRTGFWEENTPTGLFYSDVANSAYMIGSSTRNVNQFAINRTASEITANNIVLTGNVISNGSSYVAGNFYVQNSVYFPGTTNFGTASIAGTLSATSTITLSGATSAVISLGTSVTTGSFLVGTGVTTGTFLYGGTAQTGNTVFGRSTLTNNLEIANGITVAANTKTVGIGNYGLAGSNTVINIGVGSAGNTSINFGGIVYVKNTQAAISNTTGALQVQGGVAVTGNIYSGNIVLATGNSITFGDSTVQTTAANIAYIQGVFNSANANISYILGIDSGQNTYAQAAYTQANTATSIANAAVANIGPVITTNSSAVVIIANTATSTSPTSGALQVQGGLGVIGNSHVSFAGYFGDTYGTTSYLNPAIVAVGNANNFAQIVIQNKNSGKQASSDVAASADNGSDLDTYIDMGITSSTYNQTGYGLTGVNDGYLIVSGNTVTGGGNLVISTYTPKDIIFAQNGGDFANEVARFKYGTGFVLKTIPVVFADGTTQNTAAAPWAYSNASFAHANAAYSAANNVTPQIQPAYNQANVSANIANAAYAQANAISSYANTTLAYGTGVDLGQNAYAQAAYAQANAISSYANTTLTYYAGIQSGQNSYAQAAYAQANAAGSNQVVVAAYNQANVSANIANAAYAQANAISSYANTTLAYGAGVDLGQNAYTQAAFTVANNAVANLGPIITTNSAARVFVSNTTASTSNGTGALIVTGGVGVTGNVYIGSNSVVGFANATSVSVVYQFYNASTNSLDTVFG